MKIALPFAVIIYCLLCFGCRKKAEPVTYSGRLLFTHKNPIPIANKEVALSQYGYNGALGGSSSAGADTRTDATGFFQLNFTPGTATFVLLSSTNHEPFIFTGNYAADTTLTFYRSNFPESAFDVSKPIYIGKTVDTAVISVQLSSTLTPTDTMGLQAVSTTGRIYKEYTGKSGAVGAVIVLDTLYNMLFTEFDCQQKVFTNTLRAGRKYKYLYSNNTISSEGPPLPIQLPEEDQGRQDIKFYFKK